MIAGKRPSSLAAAASLAPPPPTATAVLDEVMAALTLNITATNTAAAAVATASDVSSGPLCCHGSTSDHFPDGRAYSDVITGILAVQKDGKEKILQFYVDHAESLRDLNFSQYTFALCTSWYLKTKTTNDEMKLLLSLATTHKYFKDDKDKAKRYGRAIAQEDDRGVINCLSRETKSFCDCMQAKKMEAKGMAKRELCSGCRITFPRKDMLICGGCKSAMYCNEECQTKDWPKHRGDCYFFRTKPPGKNDQNN